MRDINHIPFPPRPIIGGLPWHPETRLDLFDLDLSQLPIATDEVMLPGYRHLFSVRLVDYPENRDAVKQILIRQFERQPASSFLRETESGLLAVRVYEKESTE